MKWMKKRNISKCDIIDIDSIVRGVHVIPDFSVLEDNMHPIHEMNALMLCCSREQLEQSMEEKNRNMDSKC